MFEQEVPPASAAELLKESAASDEIQLFPVYSLNEIRQVRALLDTEQELTYSSPSSSKSSY